MAEQAFDVQEILVLASSENTKVAFSWDDARVQSFKENFSKARRSYASRSWTVTGASVPDIEAWALGQGMSLISEDQYRLRSEMALDVLDVEAAPGIAGLTWGDHPFLLIEAPRTDALAEVLESVGARHDGRVWELPGSSDMVAYLNSRAAEINALASDARSKTRQMLRHSLENLTSSSLISVSSNAIWLKTPYNDNIRGLMNETGLGRWIGSQSAYMISMDHAVQLLSVMPQIEEWASAPSAPRQDLPRKMVLASKAPQAGRITRSSEGPIVIERIGKEFALSEKAEKDNPHLAGQVGQMVCYAYYRAATDEEAAQLPPPKPGTSATPAQAPNQAASAASEPDTTSSNPPVVRNGLSGFRRPIAVSAAKPAMVTPEAEAAPAVKAVPEPQQAEPEAVLHQATAEPDQALVVSDPPAETMSTEVQATSAIDIETSVTTPPKTSGGRKGMFSRFSAGMRPQE